MGKALLASDRLSDIYDLSIKKLTRALEGKENVTDLTKMAVTSLGVYVKMRSIELHADIFKFQVIKDISKDTKELKQYINACMPEVKPIKSLK